MCKSILLEHDFSVAGDLKDDHTNTKVRAALEAKKTLRRTYLGETLSESIFGDKERYDAYSVTRVEINANNTLSNEEKNRRLVIAENDLSPEVAQSKRYERNEKALKTKISALQKNKEQIKYAVQSIRGQIAQVDNIDKKLRPHRLQAASFRSLNSFTPWFL
jgi:lipase chaperone LimK